MNIVETQNFKMFPVNKSQDNSYSFNNNSPVITFSFNENNQRIIKTDTMKLCGKVRLYLKNAQSKKLPANRFDAGCTATSQQDYEKVAYIPPRVSINSMISVVNVSNMKNNILEQVRNYSRNMSSLIPVTSSFKDLNSVTQHSHGSYPNIDCVARACQSDIPFCLPIRCGFLDSNQNIMLNQNGFQLELSLDSTNMALFGLNASDFDIEFLDLYLTGRYLVLEQPLPNAPMEDEYVAYHNFMTVLNSGNDHTNLNLQLKQVHSIYHNNIPGAWLNSYKHNSLATTKIMNFDTDYENKELKKIDFNRGAVRYPLNFGIDETKINQEANGFQSLRSRLFLNAIRLYAKNKRCAISPESEDVRSMVEERTDYKKTPQSLDQGLIKSWVYTAGGSWNRSGSIESAGNVFGVGINLDELDIRSTSDYSQASYNFSLSSGLDNTANNQFIFTKANTQLVSDGNNTMAMN